MAAQMPSAAAQGGMVSEALQRNLMGPDKSQHNLQAVKQRVEELYAGLNDITLGLQNLSQPVIWHDVLGKFVLLSIQYNNIMQQLRPMLKLSIVHPKLVDSSIMSAVLPLQLSTFPLPEMQLAEADLNAKVDEILASAPVSQAYHQVVETIQEHNKLLDYLLVSSTSECESGILDPQSAVMKELKAAGKKLATQVQDVMAKRAVAMQGGAGKKGSAAGRGQAKRKRDPQDELVNTFLVGEGLRGAQQGQAAARR